MAAITTSDDLMDYCLLKLGSPVINIEVDVEQMTQCVNDALEFFFERHHAGYDEVFLKKVIKNSDVKNGYISLNNKIDAVVEVLASSTDSGERMFDLDWQYTANEFRDMASAEMSEYFITMSHLALVKNMMTVQKSFNYNSISTNFVPNWNFTSVGSGNLLKDKPSAYTTSGSPTVTDNASNDKFGKPTASTIVATQAGLNTLTSTIDSQGAYVTGIRTLVNNIRSDNFAGDVTFTVKDSAGSVVGTATKTCSSVWQEDVLDLTWVAGTHVNDIVVEISFTSITGGETIELSNPYLYFNNIIVLRSYQTLDPTVNTEVFNDRWVKEYTTALIKRQWGNNIKKYEGIQLPGGITMNGQAIFDEANEEISALKEEFSLTYELPVDFHYA